MLLSCALAGYKPRCKLPNVALAGSRLPYLVAELPFPLQPLGWGIVDTAGPLGFLKYQERCHPVVPAFNKAPGTDRSPIIPQRKS